MDSAGSETVLVVCPHPDDETLGCGGTIFKHKGLGDKVYWLIMTEMKVEDGYTAGAILKRNEEIGRVAEAYGFDAVFQLNFSTRQLDTVPVARIVQRLSEVVQTLSPTVVYLPFGRDVHTDHRITFNAAISSMKTFRNRSIRKILAYEVVSETEFAAPIEGNGFIPNVFIDVSKTIERKISVMQLYDGETRKHPFPRSLENIKALATFRGATAGVDFAEAFVLIKEVW